MPQDFGLPLPVTSGPSGSSSHFNNTAYQPIPNSTFPSPPASTSSTSTSNATLKRTALEKLALLKGKGKAVDRNTSNDEIRLSKNMDVKEDSLPHGLSFSVRFTAEGVEDILELWVGEGESVREVKRRVSI